MARKIRGRNEGSISKRKNGTYRAQISIGGGKRISFGATTKVECQEWLRERQHEIDGGFDIKGSGTTLEEYLKEWIKNTEPSLRAKTAFQYRELMKKHITPHLGQIPLKDITQQRIERFYGDLRQAGVGVRTVRYNHAILHKAFEKAVMYGLLVRNPAHGATLPRIGQQEMSVLDEAQVGIFLTAASGSFYEALYHLAVVTGMRQGELFGLKWSDLQWNTGLLYVQRQVQRVPGKGWGFVEPKTKAGRRPIRLGPGTVDVLRAHNTRQDQLRQSVGKRWVNNNLIFPNGVGNPMEPSNMRLDFNRVLKEAGLPKIRFHDLRHTAASLMLNHNIPVLVVSKMLGHSKPSVTLDIYAHLYHASLNEAAMLMDQLVTPIKVDLSPQKVDAPARKTHSHHPRDLHQSAPQKKRDRKNGLSSPRSGGLVDFDHHIWRPRQELNPEPTDSKSGALSN